MHRGQVVSKVADMSSSTLSDPEVIDRIGAEALRAAGYSDWQIKKWVQSTRGIPWRERAKVAKVAAAKKVRLPADFLHEQRRAPSAA